MIQGKSGFSLEKLETIDFQENQTNIWHAVILAGGKGSRLWPLSTAKRPKFLLDPLQIELEMPSQSLLQQTAKRLQDISGTCLYVVCGKLHGEQIKQQIPSLSSKNLWMEPASRNTLAAVAWAALQIFERYGADAVMGTFPADHVISDQRAFSKALRTARLTAEDGSLVALGINPTTASTAYGYIQVDTAVKTSSLIAGSGLSSDDLMPVYLVNEFIEKPDKATALAYLDAQNVFWNAGIYVFKVGALLEFISKLCPQTLELLKQFMASGENYWWEKIPNQSIDRAISEPLAKQGIVKAVPVEMGWDDVGSFTAIANIYSQARNFRGIAKRILEVKSCNNLVIAPDFEVEIVGLEDCVVVQNGEKLLICHKNFAQDVQDCGEFLEEKL